MRKLILSMNMTLDGYMAGAHSELDWHFRFWTEEMNRYAAHILNDADTILLGRVTYEAMAGYWPSEPLTPQFPREDIPFADMMNNYDKIVLSRSLQNVRWNNSRIVNRNAKKEIIGLKHKPGKNIIVYGSGKVANALIKYNLVDEYLIWVHPVLLGKGRALFRGAPENTALRLLDTKIFGSGVVVLYYGPNGQVD